MLQGLGEQMPSERWQSSKGLVIYFNMLHDPHTIPEPVLVLSGLSYAVPACLAYRQGRPYSLATNLYLLATTVGFHGTRQEWIFLLDCTAIVNFLWHSYTLAQEARTNARILFAASTAYSLLSYCVGWRYQMLSFHPDWNTQMFFHAWMHISTSYSMYKLLEESQDV